MQQHCLCQKNLIPLNTCVCTECINTLQTLRLPSHQLLKSPVSSLYRYEEPLRSIVLAAKVKNDYRALRLAAELFVSGTRLMMNDMESTWHSTAIMPMPSSLWGRLRGRFDLAAYLSMAISRAYAITVLNSPFNKGWHLHKQAMIPKRLRFSLKKPKKTLSIALPAHIETLIVVDDLVTTGQTFAELRAALPCSTIKLLTLAKAAS
jgi:predicted amidophosphoribosyltransferase